MEIYPEIYGQIDETQIRSARAGGAWQAIFSSKLWKIITKKKKDKQTAKICRFLFRFNPLFHKHMSDIMKSNTYYRLFRMSTNTCYRCEIQEMTQRTTMIFVCDYIILFKRKTGEIMQMRRTSMAEAKKKSYK